MCLKCAVYLCFSWNAVCGTVDTKGVRLSMLPAIMRRALPVMVCCCQVLHAAAG